MSFTLVRGKYVICKIHNSQEPLLIEDGAVLQTDGVITDIGKYADLAAKYRDAEVLGSSNHVLIPGLINAHHHIGLTPLQKGVPDKPLELWFASRPGGREVESLYLDTLYSAFEMIESGVTTVQHIHGWTPGSLEHRQSVIEDILRAYEDIGMRASYSYAFHDQNSRAYLDDTALVNAMPVEIRADINEMLDAISHPLEESFELFVNLHKKFQETELLKIQLAPGNFHWCTDRALEMTRDYSDKYDVPIHMHLLETPYQKEYARRRTGGITAINHLHNLGLLTPRMTLGHSVWATEKDIELLADTGTSICHNCSSNMRLRSGTLPLMHYCKHNVPVAIGIDEAGLNDDKDMLQEMRLVLNMHRPPGMDDIDVPSAAQVFKMATEDGAKTTPFGDRLGALEIGKAADMVLIDWQQIAYPYLDSSIPILDAILHRGKPRNVDTVMIAGKVVYQGSKFNGVDKDAVLAELADAMRAPLTAKELDFRVTCQHFEDELKKFYANYYDDSAHVPFHHLNSKV